MTNTETVGTERLTALRQKLIDGADITVREEEEIFAALTELLASRTQSPAEWQVEAAARVLVPVWYGGFEDQTQKEEGGWLHPPGTPNKRARDTARAVLRAATLPAPERSKEETGVKRYDFAVLEGGVTMVECADGPYCHYRDIAALETPSLHKEGEAE